MTRRSELIIAAVGVLVVVFTSFQFERSQLSDNILVIKGVDGNNANSAVNYITDEDVNVDGTSEDGIEDGSKDGIEDDNENDSKNDNENDNENGHEEKDEEKDEDNEEDDESDNEVDNGEVLNTDKSQQDVENDKIESNQTDKSPNEEGDADTADNADDVADDEHERRKAYLKAFPIEYNTNNKNPNNEQSLYYLQHASELDIPVPRNLNILLSGDSLTRYQYLDLAYFLAYGKWVNPSDTPNLEIETDHEDWVEFYNFTNTALQPYEECDCFRGPGSIGRGKTVIENRYFLDKERNNSLTYLQKFGDWEYRSSWDVSDVHNKHDELITDKSQLNFKSWGPWVEMIQEFVCKLNPKPSVFIFNEGLWSNNDLVDVNLQDEIIHALNVCNIKTIFKTTTKKRRQTDRQLKEYEIQLCKKTDHCMDTSWTSLVPGDFYWNDGHFKPPIYSFLNLQLLSILSSNDEIQV